MKIKLIDTESFFGKLLLSHLVLIFISLTVTGIIFGYLIQNYYFGLKEWEATNNGRRIAELVSENISGGSIRANNLSEAVEKINTIARSSNMDIGLMNAEGRMILNAPTIKDFNLTLEKIEIEHVLKGNAISKKLMGPEYKNLLMVIPLLETPTRRIEIMGPGPIQDNTKQVGAVIIQTPLGGITATVNNIIKLILYSSLIAIIAAVFLSISFSKRVTRPLADIERSVLKSARGKYQEVSIPENSSMEIKHLVNTFNYAVKQINETLEKKKQLEKIRKEFVANVSHEFRAPLTSIKGFLELINEQKMSDTEIKEYISIMYQDTEYLEHLLADLLDLGQLEANNVTLKLENVEPRKLVSRAVNSLNNRVKEKEIQINSKFDDHLPEIKVDHNRIHQVLINLLDNAINYSPHGGQITITVKNIFLVEGSPQNRVKFSITDQGPGIPEEEIQNIWQRFYKIDQARTRKKKRGSGLGLAIVRDIISKHNGIVQVESIPGSGSTFSFTI